MHKRSIPSLLLLGLSLLCFIPGICPAREAPVAAANIKAQSTNSLTFFVASDLHYGWPRQGSNLLQKQLVSQINATPGVAYPPSLGGSVGQPRGVLLLGDLIENQAAGNLAAFEKDWAGTESKLINFPVFEGLGNHDMKDTNSWPALKARNSLKTGLDGISSNGFHYSWTWDGIHFVMLNVSPAIQDGLSFLASDLRKQVGNSGMPVVLLQHYPVQAGKRWAEADIDAFFAVLKGYNVLCIVHGHTHSPRAYKARGIDVIDDGSLKRNNRARIQPGYMVVRIQDNKLIAVLRDIDGRWGKVLLQKTFKAGKLS